MSQVEAHLAATISPERQARIEAAKGRSPRPGPQPLQPRWPNEIGTGEEVSDG